MAQEDRTLTSGKCSGLHDGFRVGDRVELAPRGYTASGRPRDGIVVRGHIEAFDPGPPHPRNGVVVRLDDGKSLFAVVRELTRVGD